MRRALSGKRGREERLPSRGDDFMQLANARMARNTRPHPTSNPVVRGEGIRFWDREGNLFLDFAGQTLNLLLGQCHPVLTAAVIAQVQTLTFASSRFSSEAYLEVVDRLLAIAPSHLGSVNLKLCDGSDANETAVKVARKSSSKSRLVVLRGAHVGQTAQALNLRSPLRQESVLGSSEDVAFVRSPLSEGSESEASALEAALDELDRALSENVAAFLADPVLVNKGVAPASVMAVYLRKADALCKVRGIAFILDEIQSFGWVPTYWTSTLYRLQPDLVTVAKGLSSGFPLAACLMRPVYADVLDYNEADFTNGGHPISCAAAAATLRLLAEEDFHIDLKGTQLVQGLVRIRDESECLGAIRNIGLICGMDVVDGEGRPSISLASSLFEACLQKGLFIRQYGPTVVFKPPIIIGIEEIDAGLDRFASAVEILREEGRRQ